MILTLESIFIEEILSLTKIVGASFLVKERVSLLDMLSCTSFILSKAFCADCFNPSKDVPVVETFFVSRLKADEIRLILLPLSVENSENALFAF